MSLFFKSPKGFRSLQRDRVKPKIKRKIETCGGTPASGWPSGFFMPAETNACQREFTAMLSAGVLPYEEMKSHHPSSLGEGMDKQGSLPRGVQFLASHWPGDMCWEHKPRPRRQPMSHRSHRLPTSGEQGSPPRHVLAPAGFLLAVLHSSMIFIPS